MQLTRNSLVVEIGAVEIRLEETAALPASVRLSARAAEETAAVETELGELGYLAVRVEGKERQEDSSTDPLANAAIAIPGVPESRIVMGKVITSPSPSQAARLAGALAGALAGGLAGGAGAVAGFVAGTAGEGEAEAVELVAVAGAVVGLVAGAKAGLVAARAGAGAGEGAVVGAGGGYVAGIAVAAAALAGALYVQLRALEAV